MGLRHDRGILIRTIPLKKVLLHLKTFPQRLVKLIPTVNLVSYTDMLWVSVPNTLHLYLDARDVKSLTCAFFAQVVTIKLEVALVKQISGHVHVNSAVQEATLTHSAKILLIIKALLFLCVCAPTLAYKNSHKFCL